MPSAATVYQTLNLIAITCAALGGSTAARRRGLDPVGILSRACISGLGGGLLRDVLLQDGVPRSIANPWNPAAALAAGAAGVTAGIDGASRLAAELRGNAAAEATTMRSDLRRDFILGASR